MKWAIELLGRAEDLEAAKELFAGEELSIAPETLPDGREAKLLTSSKFEELENHREVNSQAEVLVTHINGILFLGTNHHKPLRLAGGPMQKAANGGWNYVLVGEPGMIVIESPQSAETELENEPVNAWVKIARSSELVRQALKFLSKNPGWVELYKAIECVQTDTKNWKKFAKSKFRIPPQQLKIFKESAGEQERHLPSQTKTPNSDSSMSLDDGRAFVRQTIRDWLNWRLDNQ